MFIDKLLYLKLCWNRANSHIGIPLGIMEKLVLLAVFLKVFDIQNYWIIGILGVKIMLFMFTLGHYDIRRGVFDREQELNNKHNPMLQEIKNKIGGVDEYVDLSKLK